MKTLSGIYTPSPEALLETARITLFAPNQLESHHLDEVFNHLMRHQLDYADLYFQYTRSEGWSLEEGQVKTASFNIDQGVGVRAVSGEKTAFAYSDDISHSALLAASEATRAIARIGAHQRHHAVANKSGHALYQPIDPLTSLQDAEKVALL